MKHILLTGLLALTQLSAAQSLLERLQTHSAKINLSRNNIAALDDQVRNKCNSTQGCRIRAGDTIR